MDFTSFSPGHIAIILGILLVVFSKKISYLYLAGKLQTSGHPNLPYSKRGIIFIGILLIFFWFFDSFFT